MIIDSSYYSEIYDIPSNELGMLYDLYLTWCNDNVQHAEMSKEQFLNNPSIYFDHVCYHAEIIDSEKVENLLLENIYNG